VEPSRKVVRVRRCAARWAACLALGAALAGCAASPHRTAAVDLERQVADAERSFAKTMVDRDHARFGSFVSEEAVFFSGPTAIRGRSQVMAAWKRFYESAAPPFSWEPESVQVLDTGTLALSSGPVRDSRGKLVATFTSIWRLEAPGVWRVVFDKGSDVCECAGK
jgi:ketosteroid isomerase-like protein